MAKLSRYQSLGSILLASLMLVGVSGFFKSVEADSPKLEGLKNEWNQWKAESTKTSIKVGQARGEKNKAQESLEKSEANFKRAKERRNKNPESRAAARAADRAFDEVIRAKNKLKKAEEKLKKAEDASKAHSRKGEKLADKIDAEENRLGKTDKTWSLSETGELIHKTIEGFGVREKYKSKTRESNKEDKSVESQSRGGVKRGEGSGSSPMMSYP